MSDTTAFTPAEARDIVACLALVGLPAVVVYGGPRLVVAFRDRQTHVLVNGKVGHSMR